MIKPKPYIYKCPSCGWQKMVKPMSDALRPGEYFDACPKCGDKSLRKEKMSAGLEFLINLKDKF